jgi:class 3 adenylate cyclase
MSWKKALAAFSVCVAVLFAAPTLHADSGLGRCLGEGRAFLTREQLEESPDLAAPRAGALADLDELGAGLVLPILFRGGVTGIFALGDKRSGAAYSTFDLRVLRLVANQSAVAIENARAYTALQQANTELRHALRRVEILESIRASLSKFVPATVQRLIEEAPESPELDKREVDVSVLFVDIAGYTRLAERLDSSRVNELVELYFGAFLDEILRHGGDVNETAGDGLMVIFQSKSREPGRGPVDHALNAARAALAIRQRTVELNEEHRDVFPSVALHMGINSGEAWVGATKIGGAGAQRWTFTATGPTTNLAARFAGSAQGDEIVVGPATAERVLGAFVLENLGEKSFKNVSQPLRVYRIIPPGVYDKIA